MQDCLHITGLRIYGFTGFFPEERALGQWYELDLTTWLDLSKAGESDRLEDTYDYRDAIRQVQEHVKLKEYLLIERLAEAIAQILLSDQKVEQVRVRLTKVSPPIPDFTGRVSVEITRPR